jgi:hypothetical protein
VSEDPPGTWITAHTGPTTPGSWLRALYCVHTPAAPPNKSDASRETEAAFSLLTVTFQNFNHSLEALPGKQKGKTGGFLFSCPPLPEKILVALGLKDRPG